MENKYSKGDFVILIGFFIILVATLIILSYYLIYNVQTCTKDPLKYAVERIKENSDADVVSGSISLIKFDGGSSIHYFSSDNNRTKESLPSLNISWEKNKK